jgi:hypothetical protein
MNITVIIPIHEYNEVIKGYLDKAIESVVKQEGVELPKVIIVAPETVLVDVVPSISLETHPNISYVANLGNTDYQSQVNLGVKSVTTDYFSVLEFDDEYSNSYFKNATKYVEDSY